MNEIKRMQELAGINEIKITNPIKNEDLLSFIKQNQDEVANEIGATSLEDIIIDGLGDVGALAIFDNDGYQIEGGVAFRYSEDVGDDFKGENNDEPRPIEIAGKQLVYISFNI